MLNCKSAGRAWGVFSQSLILPARNVTYSISTQFISRIRTESCLQRDCNIHMHIPVVTAKHKARLNSFQIHTTAVVAYRSPMYSPTYSISTKLTWVCSSP